ncbi:MAG: aspartate aminotransferase family protein [Myxococcota bacterium]
MTTIPKQGMERAEVMERLAQFRAHDLNWRSGQAWAYVYDAGDTVEEVCKTAYNAYMTENALDPTAFPSLLEFENQLVRMMAHHLGGTDETVGNFSSGGTESILLAVKTARDYTRARHPERGRLNIVLPSTAHAAFHKAAHYLDLELIVTPVHPETFRADVEAVRTAINDHTCLVVGSAPSYAHGVVDPIREMAQVAQEADKLFHVDACIGGFLLPFFKRLGADVPDFDLSVPGVTSLSVDLHKYGFTAKGASVILYANKELRQSQIYACAGWTGYTIVNTTVQSTKSGGPLSAAWAVLNFIGDDGYMELAQKMFDATRRFIDGIQAIDGLDIMGNPDMNLVAVSSDEVNIFHVADEMKQRGWFVQPQLAFGDHKENIHLSINPKALDTVDGMLAALAESVEAARHIKPDPMVAGASATFSALDPSQFDDAMFGQMLAMAGINGVALPERMADINGILNAMPASLREKLLISFINELYI